MNNLKLLPKRVIALALLMILINSCEIFDGNIDEIDIYGTWNIENVYVNIKVEGDNFFQLLLFRQLARIAENKINDEMNNEIDSIGGSLTFNNDYTFQIALFEDADTGTWHYDEEGNTISLTAEETSFDSLTIEKLNSEDLIISWISDREEFETDSTGTEMSAQIKIEAHFEKE